MKIKKASGPDKINNKLIRALKSSLSNILSDIFSLSLKHGYIPKAWKQAAVLLIKKSDKLLFLLYVSDCPFKNMKQYTATQFADDLSISTTSKNIEKNINHMQKAINILSEWCNNWRISISQSKTKLITLAGENSPQNDR